MATQFITAVILTSPSPDRLAKFYQDVLEIPLEVEEHGGGPRHFGCEMGELHFAIHPSREPGSGSGNSAVGFGLQIFNLDAFLARAAKHGVTPLYPPTSRGFALMTTIKDPDGNTIHLTQLTDKWLEWIKERRQTKDFDIIQQWNASKNDATF